MLGNKLLIFYLKTILFNFIYLFILKKHFALQKLGGWDVCTSKQEVVGLNPARVACEIFFTDTRRALSMQCYTHVGVGQNKKNKNKKSVVNPFASEAVYTRNFVSDRMADSV